MSSPTKEEYIAAAEERIAAFIRGAGSEPLNNWASIAIRAELDTMFDVGIEKGKELMVNE